MFYKHFLIYIAETMPENSCWFRMYFYVCCLLIVQMFHSKIPEKWKLKPLSKLTYKSSKDREEIYMRQNKTKLVYQKARK